MDIFQGEPDRRIYAERKLRDAADENAAISYVDSPSFLLVGQIAFSKKCSDAETSMCLHPGQPARWHPVHWRDNQPSAPHMAAQGRSGWRIHPKIQYEATCIFRVFWKHAKRHQTGKANQNLEPETKTRLDRERQSRLGRPLFFVVRLAFAPASE